MSGFDLSTLSLAEKGDEPQALHLTHPVTGEPVATDDGRSVVLYVLSTDSKEFSKYRYQLRSKAAKGKFSNEPEDIEEREIEWSARLLMGRAWENVEWKGAPLPYTLANARMLMREAWIRDQVDAFGLKREAFLGNGSSSSAPSPSTGSDSPNAPAAPA